LLVAAVVAAAVAAADAAAALAAALVAAARFPALKRGLLQWSYYYSLEE